ncbi:MAG: hypothetical protein HQ581_01780 [Planctomycetes bacterium]|nr:hypothetical protein [Planctomycetota bacterium]
MAERSNEELDNGFRRILYDAMVLSQSLRAILDCEGYPKPAPDQISGDVEAHHMHALIQMRSMNDFFVGKEHGRDDTMVITDFPGCSLQQDRLPAAEEELWRFAHTYVAHKSWEAVAKKGSVGAAQMSKPEVIRIGMELLAGFEGFWGTCRKSGIGESLQEYAAAYERIYRENWANLAARSAGC